MAFMDKISARKCDFMDYIKNYKGQKIALLGAGLATRNMYQLLVTNGVYPHHVLANRRFLKPGAMIFGKKIEVLEDFFDIVQDKIDMIVVIENYKPEMLSAYRDKINNILFYDVTPALKSGGTCIRPFEWWKEKEKQLDEIYSELDDELSKKSLVSYVNQLISGDYSYSDGLVRHPQYFDDTIITFGKNEVFIDCGAYDGSDTLEFFNRTGSDSQAVIFEPDHGNYSFVLTNLTNSGVKDRAHVIEKAAWNCETTLRFSSDGNSFSSLDKDGDEVILCGTIDKTVDELSIRPTYIKMDIEGAELMALKGAERVIKGGRPRIAACVYHRPEDIFALWDWRHQVNSDYQYYLRRHSRRHHETVLYAV